MKSSIFERKVSRLGPNKDYSKWRIPYNCELYALYEVIQLGRLKWAGLVVRMGQQRHAKRILNARPEGSRKRGRRPKLRWEDGVDNDVKPLGDRNWQNLARNRQIWQNLLRKAVTIKGLFCR
jgi:hypothetical protein